MSIFAMLKGAGSEVLGRAAEQGQALVHAFRSNTVRSKNSAAQLVHDLNR